MSIEFNKSERQNNFVCPQRIEKDTEKKEKRKRKERTENSKGKNKGHGIINILQKTKTVGMEKFYIYINVRFGVGSRLYRRDPTRSKETHRETGLGGNGLGIARDCIVRQPSPKNTPGIPVTGAKTQTELCDRRIK